jgi:glycogen operon protein
MSVFLNGERMMEPDKRGQKVLDDSFLVFFNAHYEALEMTVPPAEYGEWWSLVVDTADNESGMSDGGDTFTPGNQFLVEARSLVILRRPLQADPATSITAAATSTPSTPSSARSTPMDAAPEPRPTPSRQSAVPPPKPALRRPGGDPGKPSGRRS